MRVRCPNCRSPVETLVDDDILGEMSCETCGSVFHLASDPTIDHLKPAESIGHFRLLEEVGVGSFGSVWMARDEELDRTVAIKIPRKGQLTREESEQFVREARAAAQLNHPNIVSVHEIGRHEESIYIVSDFVRGATLGEWVEVRQPTPSEAAKLCLQLAEALQHAHDAGVVHRDLKPGNVMLDTDGQPHIMDFGLAKREVGEVTMTIQGRIIGTPSYMSPEQARGEGHHADRRTDVYSLGVVLFQLLTGELPFRGNPRMLVVQILRDEPPRLRTFNAQVPGDLEVICLKCMEKSPERRYQTARELADELGRFLDGRPIEARPVSAPQRLWRWSKRNPRTAGLATTIAALLLVLAAGSSLAAIWMGNKQRETEAARVEAVAARGEAETNLDRALRAVETMLTEVGAEDLSSTPHMEPVQRALIEKALQFYTEFLAENQDDPRMRLESARAQQRAATMNQWLGDTERAETMFDAAIAAFQRLSQDAPEINKYRRELARCLTRKASLLTDTGRNQETVLAFENALQILDSLDATEIESWQHEFDVALATVGLGKQLLGTGELEEAKPLLEKSLGMFESILNQRADDKDCLFRKADTLHELGVLASRQSDFESSRDFYERSLPIWQRLATQFRVPEHIRRLAALHNDLAIHFQYASQNEKAEQHYDQALQVRQELLRDFPNVPEHRSDLALSHGNLGWLYMNTNRREEASISLAQAITLYESLVQRHPDIVEYASRLANNHNNMGSNYHLSGDNVSAAEHYRHALRIRKAMLATDSIVPERYSQVAATQHNLARILRDQGNFSEAEKVVSEAIEGQRRAAEGNPDNSTYQTFLRNHYWLRAELRNSLSRYGESCADYDLAIELADSVAQAFPDNQAYAKTCSNMRRSQVWIYARCPDEASRQPELAVQRAMEGTELDPDNAASWYALALAHYINDDAGEARKALESAKQQRPEPDPWDWLLGSLISWKLGEHDQATQLLQQTITWRADNDPGNANFDRLLQEAKQLIHDGSIRNR